MKRALAVAIVISGMFRPAFAVQPSIYKLLIDMYPSGGRRCAEVAATVEADFKRLSGLPLASARIVKEYATACDLELRYTAEARLHPVSTIEYAVGVPASYQGSYATMAACERDLPAQRDLYLRETGLEPLLAYCYVESTEPRNAVVLRIDGYGKPRKEVVVTSREIFGSTIGNPDGEQELVRRYAAAKLDALSSAVLRIHVLEHAIRLVYYAEKRAPVRLERLGEYTSAASCLRAKTLAEEKLAPLALPPPLLCASRRYVGGFELEMFQVKVGTYLDVIPYPTVYKSRADCEGDAGKATQEVAASVGATAVASVCQERGNTVAATVLVQKP